MKYFVYILQSLKDDGFYVGMTTNLEKRLNYHNKRLVKSTKHRVPFKLIYNESFGDRKTARDREKYLKSYKGSREKLTILENL
ncbi:MAG: GIY-YIG nuclease family protein [bacterium]|nr:GIY-YIG nuclease family protein [bacterium]